LIEHQELFNQRPLMNRTRQYPYVGAILTAEKEDCTSRKMERATRFYTSPINTTRGVLQFRGVFESDQGPFKSATRRTVFLTECSFVWRVTTAAE
jgi:hypothetical protein